MSETETVEEPEVAPTDKMEAIVSKAGVSEETALSIKDSFSGFMEQASEWREKAFSLEVTTVTQTAEMKDARESRLALRKIRTTMVNRHKELKADSLARGRALDGVKNFIVDYIKPMEAHLLEQEEFLDRHIEKQKDAAEAERREQIKEHTDLDPDQMLLRDVSDEEFERMLQSGKDARLGRIAREKAEEEERVAKAEREKRGRERADVLRPYYSFYGEDIDGSLADLSEDEFSELLDTVKQKKADHEAEQERIAKENARLKAEAEERGRILDLGRERQKVLESVDFIGADIEKLGRMSDEAFEKVHSEAADAYNEKTRKLAAEADKRRASEAAAEAKHRKVLDRQKAMREVDGETDYLMLEDMSDASFEKAYADAQKVKTDLEEAERKEKALDMRMDALREVNCDASRVDISQLSDKEFEKVLELETKSFEEAANEELAAEMTATAPSKEVISGADHAAGIVLETAAAWGERHPDIEDGMKQFIRAVIVKLEETL